MTSAKCGYCRCIVAVALGVFRVHLFHGSQCAGSNTKVNADQIAPQVRP